MCNWLFVLVLHFFHIIHLQEWMSACEYSRESTPLPKGYLNHKGIDRVRVCNYTDQGNAWYLEKNVGRIAMGNSHLQELPSTSRRHTTYTRRTEKGALAQRNWVLEQEKNAVERASVASCTGTFVLRLPGYCCSTSHWEF